MRHPVTGFALGLALALPAGSAAAQEIYQWKDASGVTHYSESPPERGDYTRRRIAQPAPAQPAAAAAAPAQARTAAAAPADPRAAQCETARGNIEILSGDAPVQQDDGSGAPRTLTDAERAAQLEFAQAAARAYCD
ncbi:DUF4124 domain-containing protein [Luteimonas huabeiensis]|uniref:DUF4124 domain-containing protein n=1 Tax=Luteimonas huabeiensis TaxID=1244513 RepID=UPI0004B5C336|nr:DUF4124 domain-containing protein [Luteimonas huabeiensis]